MKTQEEIKQKIYEWEKNDFFGFKTTDIIVFLDYENAKEFLKNESKKEEWQQEKRTPKEIMIDYMDFAWEKANNHRGLSAARTMEHYQAWLWLDGNEELSNEMEDYEFYGKDNLVKVCEYLVLDSSKWDDGERINSYY